MISHITGVRFLYFLQNNIYFLYAALFFAVSGCAGGLWDDVNYSSISGGSYDNDSYYSSPSFIGCLNEHLFNCN